MPGYGYCDRLPHFLSNLFWPPTFQFCFLRLNLSAVLSVFALTFLNEVSSGVFSSIPKDIPFLIINSGFPLSCCAVSQQKPWFRYFLPDDPILKELLDFLPDDCLNFDIPEYRIQTSAFSLCRPEGWDEMIPVPTKKLFPFPQFPSSLLSLT
ncbi:hypothetical protein [uncultured Draconibacterium sp.]|uniref:hypothetical protein n=1 Tax=uncultured Draconibacterium sp. TaxID=1573823 RepID=UPI003260FB93